MLTRLKLGNRVIKSNHEVDTKNRYFLS